MNLCLPAEQRLRLQQEGNDYGSLINGNTHKLKQLTHISLLSQKSAPAAANNILLPQQQLQNKPGIQLLENPYIQTKSDPGTNDVPVADKVDAMPDRIIQMRETNSIQRKCAHCEEEKKAQRKPLTPFIQKNVSSNNNIASDIVSHQIQSTKGSGNTMHKITKSFMESRFGEDFSNVKIHTGNYAVQLSKDLNAQAFTIDNNIYFNERKYQPENTEGKHSLAHELTHTLQQSSSSKLLRSVTCAGTPTAPPRAAQSAGHNTIDARAQAIINVAVGSDPISAKAVNIVTQIICQYYPSQAASVNAIRYDGHLASGLETQSVGSGSAATGTLNVSDQFVNDTDAAGIARRVLQVGHELQHIQQYKSGLTGRTNKPQREFRAFYDESHGDEFEGTGRMQQSTRLSLVDEAIRNYFCLSTTLKTQYSGRLTNLCTRRQSIIATHRVRNPGSEPVSC